MALSALVNATQTKLIATMFIMVYYRTRKIKTVICIVNHGILSHSNGLNTN
jgi:hypothetical protein